MALQIRNQQPVRRPLGQVPPQVRAGGYVELRLHGVGGTSPEDLLGDVAPQLVAGDRIAGFYRTADQPVPAPPGAALPTYPREVTPSGEKPPLPAERYIEAYSWGGLTSRSASRVLWVLLLPFALANAAGWMCTRAVLMSPWRFRLHRFAVRFAGLAMTLNVVVLLLMAGEDLIGARCTNNESCRASFAPAQVLHKYWFTDHTGRAMAVGALVPVAAALLFYLLSRVASGRYTVKDAPDQTAGGGEKPEQVRNPAADGAAAMNDDPARPTVDLQSRGFWEGYRSSRRLSGLHLAAALATVAGVLAWTVHRTLAPSHDDPWNTLLRGASVAVVGLVLVALAASTSGRWQNPLLLSLAGVAFVGALVDACLIGPTKKAPDFVSGMRWVATGTYTLVVLAILLTVLVVLVGGGQQSDSFVKFGPAFVLAFGFIIVNAIGALIIMRLGAWLNFPAIRATDQPDERERYLYTFIDSAAVWCMIAGIAVVLVFGLVAILKWRGKGKGDNSAILGEYPPPAAPLDVWARTPDPEHLTSDDNGWLGKVARARFFAKLPRKLDLFILLIVLACTATLITVAALYFWTDVSVEPRSLVATIASSAAVAAPLALVALMRWGWKSDAARRHIGIVWDVITFWPRAYHPFAPPCYAERAVPELQWRLWHLQCQDAKIVIAAHSQGSVIAAAALLQQPHRKPGSDVGLLTFGCPLDTLYKWAFPAYFNDDAFGVITGSTSAPPREGIEAITLARVSVWRNLYCKTDYIGNTPVSAASGLPGAPGTPVQAQTILDPVSATYVVGQPRASIGAHTGYWTHPDVWADIEGMHRPV